MNNCTLEQARAAKPKALATFGSLPSLSGIGITRIDNGYGLKVNLSEPTDAALPNEIDGVPINIEIVGPIKKQTA